MSSMKLYTKISLFLLILLFTGLSACIKEEQYPVVPVIEYGGFKTYRDISGKDSIGMLTISYTDGDGNIGLFSWDTVEPLKYNYYLKFMQYLNNQLVEVPLADPNIPFNGRIPILTPTGRNKNIKGEITDTIQLYFARQMLQSDTIAFEIYIKDRDLNKSNTVTTPNFEIRR